MSCINGFGDADAIEKERSGIEKDFGVKAIYSGADMSKGDEIDAMIADASRQLGTVDILVNNAGIQFVSPVEEFPPEKWDQIIAINLSAAFHATRAAVPGMKAKKWGRIINTASAHALVASPFKSAYVSAKHGIAGLTKTVALETATFGITANAICPGYVWTPLVEKQIPDTMAARDLTREQVINDVLLARPAHQAIRHGGGSGGSGRLSGLRHGALDHRRDHLHRWRMDGAIRIAVQRPAGASTRDWIGYQGWNRVAAAITSSARIRITIRSSSRAERAVSIMSVKVSAALAITLILPIEQACRAPRFHIRLPAGHRNAPAPDAPTGCRAFRRRRCGRRRDAAPEAPSPPACSNALRRLGSWPRDASRLAAGSMVSKTEAISFS